jgi:hypothetical protein
MFLLKRFLFPILFPFQGESVYMPPQRWTKGAAAMVSGLAWLVHVVSEECRPPFMKHGQRDHHALCD